MSEIEEFDGTPNRVLIDTNGWNDLLDEESGIVMQAIVASQAQRRIEVISCVEVYEEIVGTIQRQPEKFDELRDLHSNLAKHRLILQIKDRHNAELRHGGMLSESARYVPQHGRNAIESGLDRRSVGRRVHRATAERKALFGERERRNVELKQALIADLGIRRKELRAPIDDAYVDQWVEHRRFTGAESPMLGAERFGKIITPSAWWLAACMAAQESRSVLDNWPAQNTDVHDAIICSAAIYADTLVTSDKKLRRCLSLLAGLPYRVLDMAGFVEGVQRIEPGVDGDRSH